MKELPRDFSMMWSSTVKLFVSMVMACAFALPALAAIDEAAVENQASENHLVEVQVVQDSLAPYTERQQDHGFYFRLSSEELLLKNFISAIDGLEYSELLKDKPTRMALLNLEYKYNTGIGGFSFGVQAGKGNASDWASGQERTLNITKFGLSGKFTADKITSEPYVAPYVGFTAWQLGIEEDSLAESKSEVTGIGYNYTVGLMIQLDWLDRETAKNTTFNWGLENTFLDLYATQYTQSSGEDDPDTATDLILGAGICLEF